MSLPYSEHRIACTALNVVQGFHDHLQRESMSACKNVSSVMIMYIARIHDDDLVVCSCQSLRSLHINCIAYYVMLLQCIMLLQWLNWCYIA